MTVRIYLSGCLAPLASFWSSPIDQQFPDFDDLLMMAYKLPDIAASEWLVAEQTIKMACSGQCRAFLGHYHDRSENFARVPGSLINFCHDPEQGLNTFSGNCQDHERVR